MNSGPAFRCKDAGADSCGRCWHGEHKHNRRPWDGKPCTSWHVCSYIGRPTRCVAVDSCTPQELEAGARAAAELEANHGQAEETEMGVLRLAVCCARSGDLSPLRKSPGGRAFLAQVKREQRRRIPLEVRRAPRLMGENARATVDNIFRAAVVANAKGEKE